MQIHIYDHLDVDAPDGAQVLKGLRQVVQRLRQERPELREAQLQDVGMARTEDGIQVHLTFEA